MNINFKKKICSSASLVAKKKTWMENLVSISFHFAH
jgi:hypothetical protein